MILLNNTQRRKLAAKAKKLTRKLLEETSVLFTADTVLGWYRKLIAEKYDGSKNRKTAGRPKVNREILHWVRKVEILGIKPNPNGEWMEQIARNTTDFEDGFRKDKKYLSAPATGGHKDVLERKITYCLLTTVLSVRLRLF